MFNKLILVLNCGSSSLKFAVINPNTNKKILFGIVDSLSSSHPCIKWTNNSIQYEKIINSKISHNEALYYILTKILKKDIHILKSIIGVGHRVVHGGNKITNSIIITDNIITKISNASIFAPLHNPINILGIQASIKIFPSLSKKNVAVFDTAFHHTISKTSYLYAIPYKFYKNHNIRRYGAHGISHHYITLKTAKILDKPIHYLNIISCHLGNGASVTAICNGVSVDTSMGLTPLEGLMMGTRSGDIDPAIIFFMHNKLSMSLKEINTVLTDHSGFLGLTGVSSDCRYAEKNYYTDIYAKQAIDIFCHRLSKYIAGYTSLMENRLDAIIFTGGIGENSVLVRKLTLEKLALLGIKIDNKLNLCSNFKDFIFINLKSTLPVLVIRSNEEIMIAKETFQLIK